MSSLRKVYNRPYSEQEQKTIVKYICDNELYKQLKGDAIWKEMEQARIVKRTWQSLKQHFRSSLVYKLRLLDFDITEEQIQKITKAFFHKIVRPNASRKNARKPIRRSNPFASLDSDSSLEDIGEMESTNRTDVVVSVHADQTETVTEDEYLLEVQELEDTAEMQYVEVKEEVEKDCACKEY